ncbi:hypothetical protein A2U01_0107361 [Trifolium medium]|uniref:Uncharacterized protein n=1 Tax=Trifolium medium TaxID=97028 RepID=A0A392VF41_9FABA|nr:hypothetical protein [Trifolium medium]
MNHRDGEPASVTDSDDPDYCPYISKAPLDLPQIAAEAGTGR